MVLRVVPVDVLLAEQGEELRAEDLEVARSTARRRSSDVGARRGEELHETLGVARERHALGGQLAHHAEHRVRGERGGEGLQRLARPRRRRPATRSAARMRLSRRVSGSRMISCAVCRAARTRPAPDMPWRCAVVASVSRARSARGRRAEGRCRSRWRGLVRRQRRPLAAACPSDRPRRPSPVSVCAGAVVDEAGARRPCLAGCRRLGRAARRRHRSRPRGRPALAGASPVAFAGRSGPRPEPRAVPSPDRPGPPVAHAGPVPPAPSAPVGGAARRARRRPGRAGIPVSQRTIATSAGTPGPVARLVALQSGSSGAPHSRSTLSRRSASDTRPRRPSGPARVGQPDRRVVERLEVKVTRGAGQARRACRRRSPARAGRPGPPATGRAPGARPAGRPAPPGARRPAAGRAPGPARAPGPSRGSRRRPGGGRARRRRPPSREPPASCRRAPARRPPPGSRSDDRMDRPPRPGRRSPAPGSPPAPRSGPRRPGPPQPEF